MSRIRSIKPEFWTSAQILECSTNARLLFIGLWNFCDDAGRHPYSAKQVKAEVFPSDNFSEKDILGMLQELSKNGLINIYVNGDKQYFFIPGWKHQRIDKPQPAKYPDPFSEHSKSISGAFPPDTIGYDRKGSDKDIAPSARENFSSDFLEFYEAYPKKKSKKDAAKAYSQARRDVSHETIMAGLQRIKPTWRDPQFIPYPASWLRAGGWDDQPNVLALNRPSTIPNVL